MNDTILLGFEVGTACPVYCKIHHLAIFGMTQLSGKTTTLEALIARSGRKAIAFKTKRGEAGFSTYHAVTPYYKPRSDWQFVEGLVNVALGEKVKYEPGMRYAIMKVCKDRKDLREIHDRAIQLAKETKRDFMKSVYEKLAAYLEIVVPELEKWIFSDELNLLEGINVMDLSDMRLETQHLVIASTIEYAFSYLDHVVVVVPEAWETLPQGKMTPVKWVAQQFIRKGASIGNYLWLDSQDIGGIDKTPLRQCDNWLMGRMKEAHEVERILKQLLGLKVPKEEIQTLPLGHFYAAIGNEVKKVYVLANGVPEDEGKKVALGLISPDEIKARFLKPSQLMEEDELWKEKYEELVKNVENIRLKAFEEGQAALSKDVIEDNKFLSDQNKKLKTQCETATSLINDLQGKLASLEHFEEALAGLLIPRLAELLKTSQGFSTSKSVSNVKLNHEELTVNISHSEKTVELNTNSQQGQIMYVALNELSGEGFTESEMSEALKEHGWNIAHSSLAPQLASNLAKSGLLIKIPNTRPTKYRLPAKLKIKVAEK